MEKELKLDALEILVGDSLILAKKQVGFSSQEIRPLIPVEILTYSEYLPLFDSLLQAYEDSLIRIADKATLDVIDYLESAIVLDIGLVDTYIHTEISPYLKSTYQDQAYNIALTSIEEEKKSEQEAYDRLSLECKIIKSNYDNLQSLGEEVALPEPIPVSDAEFAGFVTEQAFLIISECERYLRNKPVTDTDNQLYNAFWEVQ